MEFDSTHDKADAIPITLKLHNLPSTIQSIAHIHSINLNNVRHIHHITSNPMVDCNHGDGLDHVKAIDSNKKNERNLSSSQKKV
jgi:hypothetical protein